MRLKICESHLTCKVENKCLNVWKWLEVVELNKKWSPPFPCRPVSCQCPWKKTLIEKKMILIALKIFVIILFLVKRCTLCFYSSLYVQSIFFSMGMCLEVYKFYQGIRFIRIMQISPEVFPSHKCFNELISPFIRICHLLFVIRNHTVTTPQKMTNSVTPV